MNAAPPVLTSSASTTAAGSAPAVPSPSRHATSEAHGRAFARALDTAVAGAARQPGTDVVALPSARPDHDGPSTAPRRTPVRAAERAAQRTTERSTALPDAGTATVALPPVPSPRDVVPTPPSTATSSVVPAGPSAPQAVSSAPQAFSPAPQTVPAAASEVASSAETVPAVPAIAVPLTVAQPTTPDQELQVVPSQPTAPDELRTSPSPVDVPAQPGHEPVPSPRPGPGAGPGRSLEHRPDWSLRTGPTAPAEVSDDLRTVPDTGARAPSLSTAPATSTPTTPATTTTAAPTDAQLEHGVPLRASSGSGHHADGSAHDAPSHDAAPSTAARTEAAPTATSMAPADATFTVPAAVPATAVTTPVAAQAPAAAGLPAAIAAEVRTHLGQVHRTADGGHATTLVLTAEGLGRVRVELTTSGSTVDLVMHGGSLAAQEALRDALPQLRASLADSGLVVGSTDVAAQTWTSADGQHASARHERPAPSAPHADRTITATTTDPGPTARTSSSSAVDLLV